MPVYGFYTGNELIHICNAPTGRVPETSQLGLQEVGVEMDKGGFVVGGHDTDHERSSVANIYAVGDVLKVGETLLLLRDYGTHEDFVPVPNLDCAVILHKLC